MAKLEQLIKELCPNGVEYVPLKAIAQIGTGSSDRINATEDGEYPFYVRSKTVLRSNIYLFDEESIVIPGEGGIGDIFHYVNGKYDLHQRAYRIHFINDKVNTKYGYYYLAEHFKKFIMMKAVSATVTSIRKPMIENFLLPLPPLTIQREIVLILDNLTKLTEELTEELEEELTARKKQYEYYRDKLLSFTYDVPRVTLGDVCIKTRNINWKDTDGKYYYIDLTSVDRETNEIQPEQIINAYNAPSRAQQIIQTNDVLFATTRPTLQRYCFVPEQYDGQICSTGYCILRANPEMIMPKFLYYTISTKDFGIYVENNQKGTSYPAISDSLVKRYSFPLPSLKEQSHIVGILDKYNTLTTDILSSLLTESETRRKQYEYYRDKLLTFKEAGE